MNKWVRIKKFCDETGETEDAVRSNIAGGMWPEDIIWRKAPRIEQLLGPTPGSLQNRISTGLMMPDGSIRPVPEYWGKPQHLLTDEETKQHAALQQDILEMQRRL